MATTHTSMPECLKIQANVFENWLCICPFFVFVFSQLSVLYSTTEQTNLKYILSARSLLAKDNTVILNFVSCWNDRVRLKVQFVLWTA